MEEHCKEIELYIEDIKALKIKNAIAIVSFNV
jgi:hypothetical protein